MSKTNIQEISVGELSAKLKKIVEDNFGYVRVKGEISGYRGPHSSGHSYFAIKDENARLEAIIWRGQSSKLGHQPEEGLEVVASGKLTTYAGSSKYQIIIDQLEPAGAGALMALLDERRKKLEKEGLFNDEHKQQLPFLPRTIAVITSPTGAVLHDIMHRINERFPLHILVWPARMQGDTCGNEVANAITQLNKIKEGDMLTRPDLIIVARGGGSLEDLWGFNDEIVVRAAWNSDIPLISAVGHETDWTLLDYVADERAPTPTGAAEIATQIKEDLEFEIEELSHRHKGALTRFLEKCRTNAKAAMRGLASPDTFLALPRQRFDENSKRHKTAFNNIWQRNKDRVHTIRLSPAMLTQALKFYEKRIENLFIRLNIEKSLKTKIQRMNHIFQLLETLSYKNVLSRGYAVVRDENSVPIASAENVKIDSFIKVEMHDGTIGTQVKDKN